MACAGCSRSRSVCFAQTWHADELRNIIYKMTGMPISAIVLPAGTGTGVARDRMSAAAAQAPPVAILTGSTILCTAVPVIRRAICGAIIPTKPIGPQNAVTAPVMIQHPVRDTHLIFSGIAPESEEYSSPNSRMSSPLVLLKARQEPIIPAAVMTAIPV